MSFSKIRMGIEEIFTILVEDQDGRKLGNWKVMKRDLPKAIGILFKQFGIAAKVVEKKSKKDLDWAFD